MRRMLLSAVVAVLLGACLVLAQPGGISRPAPYGAAFPGGASLSGLPTSGVPVPYSPLGSINASAAMGLPGPAANAPPPIPGFFVDPPTGPPMVIRPNYSIPQNPPNVTEVLGLNNTGPVPGVPMAPPVPEMNVPQGVYAPMPDPRMLRAMPDPRMPQTMPMPDTRMPMRMAMPIGSNSPTVLPRGTSPAYANLQQGQVVPNGIYPIAPGQMLVYPVGSIAPDGTIRTGPAMQAMIIDADPQGVRSPMMSWQPGVGQVYRPMPEPSIVRSIPQSANATQVGGVRGTLPPAAGNAIPGPTFWASIEGLLWWVRSSPTPVLVAAVGASPTGGPRLEPLFGGQNINPGVQYGLRGTVGLWLDDERTLGATGSYFWLAQRSRDYGYSSPGNPAIVRTFVNLADGNKPGAIPLANGNGSMGGSNVRYDIQLQGGDASAIFSRNAFLGQPFELLVGVRYFLLEESLRLEDRMTNVSNGIATTSLDSFATRNQFFGGQVGARWNVSRDRFRLDATTKVAYGAMIQTTTVDGSTSLAVRNGPPIAFPGGTLALPTNNGTYRDTKLAVIPEVDLRLGYRLSEQLTLFAGCNMLYVTDVVRPGSRIDTGVNPDYLPLTRNTGASSALRPGIIDHRNDFWAMGLSAGFALSY